MRRQWRGTPSRRRMTTGMFFRSRPTHWPQSTFTDYDHPARFRSQERLRRLRTAGFRPGFSRASVVCPLCPLGPRPVRQPAADCRSSHDRAIFADSEALRGDLNEHSHNNGQRNNRLLCRHHHDMKRGFDIASAKLSTIEIYVILCARTLA